MGFDLIELGEVAELKNGYAFKSKDFTNYGTPVVKIKNITPPIVSIKDVQYVNDSTYQNTKGFELHFNDVLISMTGSGANQMSSAVGKVGKVRYKERSLQNQRVGKIISKDESIYSMDFLYFYLTLNKTLEYFVNNSSGSANQANISGSVIKRLKVPNIEIQEQRKIANLLSSFDNKIENNNAMIANLEEQAQTIFKSWFVDFEPFQDEEFVESELGEIPQSFKVQCISDFASISSGKRRKNADRTEQNKYPIVGATKVTGYTDDYLTEDKVIITGRVGTLGSFQLFKSKIWPSDNTLVLKSDIFGFTYFSLKQVNYKALNRGSTQPLLTQTDIKNSKVAMPNINWLNTFESIVNPMMEMYWQLNEQNKQLTEIRDSLLPKLMSGEIRVGEVVTEE